MRRKDRSATEAFDAEVNVKTMCVWACVLLMVAGGLPVRAGEASGATTNAAAGGRRDIHALVQGRVQGVGFRAFTAGVARRLGLRGWVQNLASGDVEVRAQGDAKAMQEFEASIRKGPEAALVTNVVFLAVTNAETLAAFQVRYLTGPAGPPPR